MTAVGRERGGEGERQGRAGNSEAGKMNIVGRRVERKESRRREREGVGKERKKQKIRRGL